MPSYNFGYSKYIDSPQGNLDIADIDITGSFSRFNIVPVNVYEFKSVEWYKDNGYFYYALDYPSWTQKPFPKWFEIGSIFGTSVYGAVYVDTFNVPPGTPLDFIPKQHIKLVMFCGDMNGEQTVENPLGVRIGSFYQFDLANSIKYGLDDAIVRTEYYFKGPFYGFFSVLNSQNKVYFCSAPLNKEEKTKISSAPLEYSYENTMVIQSAINTYTDYTGIGSLDLISVDGSEILIDDLPEEVNTSSTGGGGIGLFNLQSDVIDWPQLPTLGAANSGLLALYNPSISQLASLSRWLWSTDLLDSLEKMFAQPLDLIVTLNIVPCIPSGLGNVERIKIGGVDTGVSATRVTNQYAVVNCGTLHIPQCYGSAMDYGKYTKITLFLPFLNAVHLNTDEVMGSNLSIRYFVDLFTGSFTACIRVTRLDNNGRGLDAILYSYEGNMAVSLPLTSRDFSTIYQNLAKIGTSAIGATSGGALGSAVAIDSAISVMNNKPNLQRTSGASSTGGLLGIKTPYVIIERAIQSLPQGYNHFNGYPSNITSYLYALKGYTEVEEIIVSDFKCTQEEQDEIVKLLKEGVYL